MEQANFNALAFLPNSKIQNPKRSKCGGGGGIGKEEDQIQNGLFFFRSSAAGTDRPLGICRRREKSPNVRPAAALSKMFCGVGCDQNLLGFGQLLVVFHLTQFSYHGSFARWFLCLRSLRGGQPGESLRQAQLARRRWKDVLRYPMRARRPIRGRWRFRSALFPNRIPDVPTMRFVRAVR